MGRQFLLIGGQPTGRQFLQVGDHQAGINSYRLVIISGHQFLQVGDQQIGRVEGGTPFFGLIRPAIKEGNNVISYRNPSSEPPPRRQK